MTLDSTTRKAAAGNIDALDQMIFDTRSNRSDPYPAYHSLRARGPAWSERQGAWLLTAYDDVLAVLRDPRASSDLRSGIAASGPRARALGTSGGWDMIGGVLPLMDPPDHTRLRRLVSKAFSPRIVETLRTHIEDVADGLLKRAAERGSLELMADLAFPLTITIICELLGVPLADQGIFRKQSPRLSAFLDFRNMTHRQLRNAADGAMVLATYFSTLVEQRRSSPGDDLISALLAAEDAGDTLTRQELVMTCIVLVSTGHETTTGLIGNGAIALLRHPDEAERFRADRSLTKPAIEELIRFDTPIQYLLRTALEDIEVGDEIIRTGEQAVLLFGAANRDPAHFVDPDELRFDRSDISHLSFGYGIHYCLGAALARLESQISLRALFERFPSLAFAEPPTWRPTTAIRCPLRAPLAFDSSAKPT